MSSSLTLNPGDKVTLIFEDQIVIASIHDVRDRSCCEDCNTKASIELDNNKVVDRNGGR